MIEAQCNTDHEEPSLVSVPESTLSLLEKEARCIAASLDGLTEHLAASLHTVVLYLHFYPFSHKILAAVLLVLLRNFI